MTTEDFLKAEVALLLVEVDRLKADNARLANENAALVAQIPTGFMFPRDGDARMIE